MEIVKQVFDQHPHRSTLSDLGGTHVSLAEMQTKMGKHQEASASTEQAVEIFHSLVADDLGGVEVRGSRDVQKYRNNLARALRNLAALQQESGEHEKAVTTYYKAVEAQQTTMTENPEGRAPWPFFENVWELGSLLSELNRYAEAADDLYRPVLDEQVSMLITFPKKKVNARLSLLRGGLVSALAKTEQRERVGTFLQGQLSTWQQLQDDCEDKRGCRLQIADIYYRLGRWFKDASDDGQADANTEIALASVRTVVEMDSNKRDAWETWKQIALFYYRSRNWKGAEFEARKAVQLVPDNHDRLLFIAPLLLLAGEDEEYGQLCRRLLDVPASGSEEEQQTIDNLNVRLCGLDPSAAGDPNRILHLAQKQLIPPTRFLRTIGRAHYRAGLHEQGVEWLRRAEAENGAPRPVIYLDLAIANHHWGRHKAAREYLDRATRLLGDRQEEILRFHAAMEAEVLRHEAEQLIRGEE